MLSPKAKSSLQQRLVRPGKLRKLLKFFEFKENTFGRFHRKKDIFRKMTNEQQHWKVWAGVRGNAYFETKPTSDLIQLSPPPSTRCLNFREVPQILPEVFSIIQEVLRSSCSLAKVINDGKQMHLIWNDNGFDSPLFLSNYIKYLRAGGGERFEYQLTLPPLTWKLLLPIASAFAVQQVPLNLIPQISL